MLVQFAIETEAIGNSATPAHITRLLDRWQRYGILVYPRRRDPGLVATISRLTPTARKQWKTAWAKVVKNNGNAYRWIRPDGAALEWSEVDAPDDLAPFHDEFEVAVVKESRATAWKIPDGESRRCGEVEGVRLRDVDIAEEFYRAETLGRSPIGRGEPVADIWRRRFQRFAAHCRQVVVVDQYAVRQYNVDGILRLLRLLDKDATRCRVTVYSCLGRRGGGALSLERRIRAATAGLTGRGVASIGVRLFRERDFGRYAHDRHLRFDNGVFRIGRGMRIFERPTTRDATDVHFVVLETGAREEKEADLESSGRVVHRFRVGVV